MPLSLWQGGLIANVKLHFFLYWKPVRDWLLFMAGRWGESNDFSQEIFSQPTRHMHAEKKNLEAFSTLCGKFSTPTFIGKNKHVLFLEEFFFGARSWLLIFFYFFFFLIPTPGWGGGHLGKKPMLTCVFGGFWNAPISLKFGTDESVSFLILSLKTLKDTCYTWC